MKIAIIRERLVRFFQEHNPEKLQMVDDIIHRYQNDPEQLFRDLEERYGAPVPEVEDTDLPDSSGNNNNKKQNNNVTAPSQNTNQQQQQHQQQDDGTDLDESANYDPGDFHNHIAPIPPQNKNNNQGGNLTNSMNNLGNAFVNRSSSNSLHSGSQQHQQHQQLLNSNRLNNKNVNVKYAEPDNDLMAQLDEWDFQGLPNVDPRYGLRYAVKPMVEAPITTENANGNNNSKEETKQLIVSAAVKPYETLLDNHVLFWFCPVKYFTEGMLGRVSGDDKVFCYISEYCIFFARARNEKDMNPEVLRVVFIHEIAALFHNMELVEKDHRRLIDVDHGAHQSQQQQQQTENNAPNKSTEETFIVLKILPKENNNNHQRNLNQTMSNTQFYDDDDSNVESFAFDCYFTVSTLKRAAEFISVVSALYKHNEIAQQLNGNTLRKLDQNRDLLVTPLQAQDPFVPSANSVIRLNIKKPSDFDVRTSLAAFDNVIPNGQHQPPTRLEVTRDLRAFAEANGIIYSRSGHTRKAPKPLIDPQSGQLLLAKRRSGVVIPITGLKAVVKEEKKKLKNNAKMEALEIMKVANRIVQHSMEHDPHRTVMNDPSDLISYRNQKGLNNDRQAAVANVTAQFASHNRQLLEQSPPRGFLLHELQQQQQMMEEMRQRQENMTVEERMLNNSPARNNIMNASQIAASKSLMSMLMNRQQQQQESYNNNNASSVIIGSPAGAGKNLFNPVSSSSRTRTKNQQSLIQEQSNNANDDAVDNNNDGDSITPSSPFHASAVRRQYEESKILSFVAPTLSESWQVLRDSAPAPPAISTTPSKTNVLRKLGAATAVVVAANRAHALTTKSTFDPKSKGRGNNNNNINDHDDDDGRNQYSSVNVASGIQLDDEDENQQQKSGVNKQQQQNLVSAGTAWSRGSKSHQGGVDVKSQSNQSFGMGKK